MNATLKSWNNGEASFVFPVSESITLLRVRNLITF